MKLGFSEIKEEQAKMIGFVDDYSFMFGDYGATNSSSGSKALFKFKSLMQHLQIYEVNPFGEEYNCNVFNGVGGFVNGKLYTMNEAYKGWQEAQSRTGKWIILFKPNES